MAREVEHSEMHENCLHLEPQPDRLPDVQQVQEHNERVDHPNISRGRVHKQRDDAYVSCTCNSFTLSCEEEANF